MRERVAITGVGLVTALGNDAQKTFRALLEGTRGFGPLRLFEPKDARATIAAEVRDLDVSSVAPAGQALAWSRTDAMAVMAAREALEQAAVTPTRLGVWLGGTAGGMFETEQGLLDGPLDRIEPARAARLLSHPLDLTTSRVAASLGGASRTATLCAACASSALAIVEGAAWLAEGSLDVVLAGGADGLCRLTFFGFDSLGALDREPCRPFDATRAGLSLGEGAGFLCLERESSARARGATILALLSGAATGAEAHHITHPEPTGARAAELLTRALESAGLAPDGLDYVNAHGTGTEQNDAMEARALLAALGPDAERVLVSSSKGQLGHTLGAAGAIEAAISVLALVGQAVPPTAGLREPAEPLLRHVRSRGVSSALRAAASCSFGFGGTGAVLVFERGDTPPRASSAGPPHPSPSAAVVVTGIAAAGSFGTLRGRDVLGAVRGAARGQGGPLAADPRDRLEPERSRRFDRSAALVTGLVALALEDAGLDGARVGLAAGTAFGSVERSVRFVLRAAERGVRLASPAEFPQLVASAAAGNASIYAGLTGPVFGMVSGAASAEAALRAGSAFLRAEQARAFVAGAAEGFDPIVAEVLGPTMAEDGPVPRAEGGGFLVLELESAALARGAVVLARLRACWEVGAGEPWPSLAPRKPERALVLDGTLSGEQQSALARSGWGGCARRSVLLPCGSHEAVSGVALAVGVSAVASGHVDEALVVTGTPSALWVSHFCRPEVEA